MKVRFGTRPLSGGPNARPIWNAVDNQIGLIRKDVNLKRHDEFSKQKRWGLPKLDYVDTWQVETLRLLSQSGS